MIFEFEDLEYPQGPPLPIPFAAIALDGITPMTGLTFSGTDLKIGKGFVESGAAGSTIEVGGGWYGYIPDVAELSDVGFISVRTTKAGLITTMSVVTVTGSVVVALPPGTTTEHKALLDFYLRGINAF